MSTDNFSGLLGQKAKPLINKLAVHTYPWTGQPLQSEPLVLIHGWGADSGIWELILPELTRTLNILAIDLPGFGQNDVFKLETDACSETNTEFSWPIEYYLDTILAMMPNKCSIMGWSLGGALATALA
ncbi:MAG: alpha/beta fold hydrolase, partial [Porticoccus sp.]|nr:alpha/beta fold hydrolase [Porticoccus sp.]